MVKFTPRKSSCLYPRRRSSRASSSPSNSSVISIFDIRGSVAASSSNVFQFLKSCLLWAAKSTIWVSSRKNQNELSR